MKSWAALIYISCFILLTGTVNGQTFTSTDKRVNVLELYTSEGCSSCPPADQWFSQLKQDKRLWKEIIPMAFHVDYWDYIGWKDRFANKTYAQRQRQYAQLKQVQVVYTPAMLLNGKEWRQWYKLKPLNLDNTKSHGKLSIEIKGKKLDASYIPISKTDKSLLLNIAILGFNLTSEVKAGENKGRTLTHDFVVLAHKIISLEQNESHYGITNVELPKMSIMDKQTAIIAWVNTEQNLTPIQATGGWMLDKLTHSDLKWSRPKESKIQKMLSHEQYTITQQEGTEIPFRNAYWDHKAEGIYVDIVSGEPLFSSTNKFTSGTGWPSFTHPLVKPRKRS